MKTKKKILLIMLLSVLMVLASSVSVWAAKNPLSKMPRNVGSVASSVNVSVTNKTYFCTEPYDGKVKISVKNSNSEVADVFCQSTIQIVNGKTKNCGNFWVTCKKPGTTTVKVTVKVNGKSYTKSCKYTFYEYANPFASIKKGTKNLTSQFKKGPTGRIYTRLKGKYSYRLKKGYKVTRILYWDQQMMGHIVNNISQVPSDARKLYLTIKNTKKNYLFTWILS